MASMCGSRICGRCGKRFGVVLQDPFLFYGNDGGQHSAGVEVDYG